jgi:DNA-binding transcriptional regulator YdaS (Cro superfamily)
MNNVNGIHAALLKAGSQQVMANQLGVSQQAISIWLRRGWVPHRRAIEIEQTYNIPRARLISPRLIDLVEGEV